MRLKLALTFLMVALPFLAEAKPVRLSIYSDSQQSADPYRQFYVSPNAGGFAIVHDTETLNFAKGNQLLTLRNLPRALDPETLLVVPSAKQPYQILSQQFRFNPLSQQALLQLSIGKTITVDRVIGNTMETTTGTLLSVDGGLTLKDEKGNLVTLQRYDAIKFPKLPAGITTEPELALSLTSDSAGDYPLTLHYALDGLSWWVNYQAVFVPGSNGQEGSLRLASDAFIANASGENFDQVALDLVAGEVRRAPSIPRPMVKRALMAEPMGMAADSAAPEFAQASLGDYYQYNLSQPVTLPEGAITQVRFMPEVKDIPATRRYVFEGNAVSGTDNDFRAVDSTVRFTNDSASKLGKPLPAGTLRLYDYSSNGPVLNFLGENTIGHTASGQTLDIAFGRAFDIKGKHVQKHFSEDPTRRRTEEAVDIILKNASKNEVTVLVREGMRYPKFTLGKTSHAYESLNAQQIEFRVKIPAGSETTVSYIANYSW